MITIHSCITSSNVNFNHNVEIEGYTFKEDEYKVISTTDFMITYSHNNEEYTVFYNKDFNPMDEDTLDFISTIIAYATLSNTSYKARKNLIANILKSGYEEKKLSLLHCMDQVDKRSLTLQEN